MPTKKQYTIGIDIGGTNIKAILYNPEKNKIIESDSLATPKDNIDHFIIMLNALIEPLIEKAKKEKAIIKGIGVGVAGAINYRDNLVLDCPNIPILNGTNFIKKINEKFNLEVILDNDTNCFLRAEVLKGIAKNYNNVYGFILGTGIGGGWWFNNKTYKKDTGGSGEPGRMITNFSEPINLEESYHKLMQNNPANMAEEAYRGDELAEKSFKELGSFLGIAFANVVNIVAPEAIVIGGGLVKSSDLFITETKKALKEFTVDTETKKIKILKSKLGDQAGSIGAALLIKHGNIRT